jgi:hypothetical protein
LSYVDSVNSIDAQRNGYFFGMTQENAPRATPKDATKATEEQRELQDELDHQHDDPDAPGRHQSRGQVADET